MWTSFKIEEFDSGAHVACYDYVLRKRASYSFLASLQTPLAKVGCAGEEKIMVSPAGFY
jgi:hypothetical protein